MTIFEGAKKLIDSLVVLLTTLINAINSAISFLSGLASTTLAGFPPFFVALFGTVIVIIILRVVKD